MKLDRPLIPTKKQLKTIDDIKKYMLLAAKIMDKFGLVQGMGHVSSRLPGSPNIMVTPRSAIGLAKLEDLVIVDPEGKIVEGKNPFAELYLHLGIYRKRPDVGAICRFHSEITSIFGVLNRSVRPVHALGYLAGPEIKVLSTSSLGHTPEFMETVGKMVEDTYGIILRGNGAATFGSNIIEACVRALMLDESAKIQYKASLLGEPVYMTLDELNQRNEDYYSLPGYDPYWRIWEYFEGKILSKD